MLQVIKFSCLPSLWLTNDKVIFAIAMRDGLSLYKDTPTTNFVYLLIS